VSLPERPACPVAVTPDVPSRESILAALRAAINTATPYGPAGGLPQVVRVDWGKDFLSKTMAAACAVFAVRVQDLPGYPPFLKGSIRGAQRRREARLPAQ
jgi:putative transposase